MMDGQVAAVREALDGAGFTRHPHARLRREVRLGVLRSVPRGRAVLAAGRPPHLPARPRQPSRGRARGPARHRRGRRHRHGQARDELPRRARGRGGGQPRAGVGVPGLRRVRDDRGGRGQRLDRPRARDRRVGHEHPSRRRRRRAHLLGDRAGGDGCGDDATTRPSSARAPSSPAASTRRCGPSARSAARRCPSSRRPGRTSPTSRVASTSTSSEPGVRRSSVTRTPTWSRRCRMPRRAALASGRRPPPRPSSPNSSGRACRAVRAGATGLHRHRGHDDRHPPRARCDRPRPPRQVRRPLPRSLRRAAGRGRVGPGDPRAARLGRGSGRRSPRRRS